MGGVEVTLTETKQTAPEEADGLPLPEQGEGVEKRLILKRLTAYRKNNGLGCLEKIASKTAYQKKDCLSAEQLRMILTGDAPRMDMEAWKKIARALDMLEAKSNDPDCA